jgi:hypothetical protein
MTNFEYIFNDSRLTDQELKIIIIIVTSFTNNHSVAKFDLIPAGHPRNVNPSHSFLCVVA